MKVIVVGAGIVGALQTLALAERGIETILIDEASEPAAGTSFANGSTITPCHAEPWNAPGIWRRLPAALLTRNRPWRIAPRRLPTLGLWGLEFLRHSQRDRYLTNTRNCVRLGLYSLQALKRLRSAHGLEYRQITRGQLELYFDEVSLDQALALRQAIGLEPERFQRLSAREAVAHEPVLAAVAGRIHGALYFPEHESGDAREMAIRAVERARQLGATLRFGERVEHLECRSGRLYRVHTTQAVLDADACIIAAGCGSPGLVRPLGFRLPIQPVKGYSATIEITESDPAPIVPLLDLQHRMVVARLGTRRLRIAGLAEFAGHDRRVDPHRLRLLLEHGAALLPDLADRMFSADPHGWTGLRPMTPDGAPLLGATPIEGLWLNTGHGAMGWTHAAGSAELLADLIEGRRPGTDLDGLLAARWLDR